MPIFSPDFTFDDQIWLFYTESGFSQKTYMFLGAVYMREEDPYRKQNNFTLSLHAEILVRVVPKYGRFEKELKMATKTNTQFGPFRSFYGQFCRIYDNNTLVVTLNEKACFVPSTRILLVKAVYMELGLSLIHI